MRALNVRSTYECDRKNRIFEYALILALIAAICIGAMFTVQDISAHLGPAETTGTSQEAS